jgi:RluA family pseudouridine synthase
MSEAIKLSSPATSEFWELPVLFEDEHLLAIDKPSRLLTSPDRYDAARPNLMKLLHGGIEANKPWARQRGLTYLMNAHRLDFETSGIILLAKNKPALVALANLFGSEKPQKVYLALVHGNPVKEAFEVNAKLAPHPVKVGLIRVDEKTGKHAQTFFQLLEKFNGCSLVQCRPVTGRTHQIRVHLRQAGLPIVGDELYGGSQLLLSRLKADYHLKPHKTERPLIDRVALHATELKLPHPITGVEVAITAPLPKDLTVALKYLRRYAAF